MRIHPEYGTVEIRIADSMPSLKDTVAVATLIQALCIKIGKDWEDGLLEKPTPTWLIENNRWSAIKKGLNAEFILDKTGKTIPIVHMIETLVDELKPIAKNLGSQDKLLDVKSILKDDGIVDSMKQIAKNGSLVDVVIFLEEKLNSSL